RDWQRAQELVRKWEAEGQRIEKPKPLTVKEACDKFLVDAEAPTLREPTLYKYRLLFRQLQEFAALQVFRTLRTSMLTRLADSGRPGPIKILRHARSSKRFEHSFASCMRAAGFLRIRQLP